jgi:HK97 family phage major capsid protein
MTTDHKGLALLIQEASTLSKKAKLTGQEERRNAWLLSSISALKNGGITLTELDEEYHNERARANGLPTVKLNREGAITASQREARSWQMMVREQRDMGEGSIIGQIGTYNSIGGTFVPTDFYEGLFASMAAHDALYEPENVTFITSTNGRLIRVPTADDTENVATLTSEAGSRSSVDIAGTGQVTLGAYSFSSPRFVVSMEAFQDLDESLSAINLAKKFFADRLARGIGNYLINGSGSSQPTGLLEALSTLAAPVITAAGSSGNDGAAATGANSLGSADFQAALSALDDAYASSTKCAWAMNKKTFAAVSGQVDKYGNILDLVRYIDGVPTVFGIKVIICPSVPNIGASNVPVVLGDFSYFATRIVTDQNTGIRVYKEATGLVEAGKVGLGTFLRADSNVLWQGSGPSPFVQIRNHS